MNFLNKEQITEFFIWFENVNFDEIAQDFLENEDNYSLKFVVNGDINFSYEENITLNTINKKSILNNLKTFFINKNFIDEDLKPINLDEDNPYIFEDNIVYIDILIDTEDSTILYGTYDSDSFNEKYEIV